MASSAAGGVTNTAQYQNRLMVYDPGQVTFLHLSHLKKFKYYRYYIIII